MELNLNQTYEGFKLLKKEEAVEINSIAYHFEHERTKAKLLFLKNDDNDKTFAITFRTPPNDSTGLPHILEHSVLCGSEKYPLKDSFATLAKSTINSFINAFTFPDKTMYPFSTTNIEEFHKLMDVYLDAVFFPNIYKHKEIFLQEGWRFEIDEKTNKLKYNGVVYGEMKGAFSSAGRILDSHTQRALFPNTCYGVESGGDPEDIVNLKYEDFLDFHKKYYHPSNSLIYLYGDSNIEDELKILNENFLSKFDYLKVDSKIEEQKPFIAPKEETIEYPTTTKDCEDKYLFGLSIVLGKATDDRLMLGLDLLGSILMDYESSPLKKALIKADLGEDVYGEFYEDYIYQPFFSITIENTSLDKKEKFKTVVNETLNKLKNEGIDKELITAAINKCEFTLKEGHFYDSHFPKGLQIAIKVMDSMLYDGEPLIHIKYNENLKFIKENLNNGYFEDLIDKYFLNNNHKALITLKPNSKLNPQKLIDEKLAKIYENLTSDEIEQIKLQTAQVKQFQEQEESKENSDKIKVLNIDKIDKLPQTITLDKKNFEEIELQEYKTKTNGIEYFNFYFDLSQIPQDKIPYLNLISDLLEETKTKNYDSDDFANLINTYLGDFNISILGLEDKDNNLVPKLELSTKILEQNFDKLILILNELFNNVIFDEAKVDEVLKKLNTRYEASILQSGHNYALTRIESYFSKVGKYNEICGGLEFYQFIKNLNQNFKTNKQKIIENLVEVYEMIFNKNNLIINIVSENFDFEKLKKLELKNKIYITQIYNFKLETLNEAFETSSQINYVGKGFNFKKLGYEYSGSLLVLRNILRYNYLWDNLRVKGGAYGAMAKINQTGSFGLVSYRDPNINASLDIYDKLPQFLENLEMDEKELRRFIIGTISDQDKPLEIEDKSKKAMYDYLRKISFDERKKERTQIINTKLIDIKNMSNLTKDVLAKNNICVIGNETLIKKESEKFSKNINIFNSN